jgi:hypothetical protein
MKTLQLPAPGQGYGVKSKKGESAEQNFKAGQKLGIAEYVQSRGESIYETVRKEPLGTASVRGHVLPEQTKQPSFKGFGKKINLDEYGSKDALFPRDVEPDKEEDKARYKKTHGAFDTGESVDRDYVWPQQILQNQHFRFGASDSKPGNLQGGGGAKTALTMDLEADGSWPKTQVADRTAETFRQVANDGLGTARNAMQGRPPVPAGHSYGLKSGHDNTHAGELMRGFYTANEQRPDPDLGKCKTQGRRNFLTKRPFGTPSVRHDLEAPPHHRRSIASSTNYGDDHSAFGLLYPEKFGFRGVSDNDFFVGRSADEMRSLLQGAGYSLEEQDFQMLWEDGVRYFGADAEVVSLEVMLNILGRWMAMAGAAPGGSQLLAQQTGQLETTLPAVVET